jgi:DNA invertase Pin-like site-specific DNA recombinase
MKSYYAYIRVSTTRQGEEGVSLQEQRRAILEYASRRGITISEWFEEQLSAAKRGRPVFSKLVGLLKKKGGAGLIIHKIDRGSRNLRDWADLGELMDRGIEVHFAHESIDLHTRSGRLSADILAVVASDYIRNLREETIKGINGRLRQGLFPFSAPLGYLNHGKGKPKTICPVRGPFVKMAFELYASREYSLKKLQAELFERGLRTRTGKPVHLSHLAMVLRNPFYMGLIRLKNKKETFPGIHLPLVSSSIYNEVQFIIDRKRPHLKQHHRFLFRGV